MAHGSTFILSVCVHQPFGDYLGRFDYPVMMINPNGSVTAANDRALNVQGKSNDIVMDF